jgi:hypothetical protein
MAIFWNGQKMVNQPEQVTVYKPPVDPYAQQIPKVTAESVAAAIQSPVRMTRQSWTGTPNAVLPGSKAQNPDF